MIEYDLLGEQLFVTVDFARHNFDLSRKYADVMRAGDVISAANMFRKEGRRWFMNNDSLPGDLVLKAIAVDKQQLFVELAPLNEAEVTDALEKAKVPVTYHAGDRCFRGPKRRQLIRLTSTQQAKDMAPRCMWIISWTRLGVEQLQLAIRTVDALHTAGIFSQEGLEVEGAGPIISSAHIPTLRLELALQQRLQIEQRPYLSQRPEGRLEMRLEIQQIMALQIRVLRMTATELEAWAMEDLSEQGQREKIRVMQFVLAGKIKKVMPAGTTWKQTREMAWRLTDPRRRKARA